MYQDNSETTDTSHAFNHGRESAYDDIFYLQDNSLSETEPKWFVFETSSGGRMRHFAKVNT